MTGPRSTGRATDALRVRAVVDGSRPTASPIVQSAAFQSGSPHFYARKSHPNGVELERTLALLEGAAETVATTTGMAALSLVLGFLRPGDALVCHHLMYGCSLKLFAQQVEERGVTLHVLDLADPAVLVRLPSTTRLVVFETPTNPFLYTVPIAPVAAAAKAANSNALVVVDGTWATPWFQQPLRHGADLVVHSLTKFVSGHSDVMGGSIAIDRPDLAEALRARRFYHGALLDAHSAWLLCRSLKTFPLRMRAHQTTTTTLADVLRRHPAVAQVFMPTIDGTQLTGYGGILFIELATPLRERYADLVAGLTLFDTGTGMAAVTSMVAQPWSGSHASLCAEEKTAMGITAGLVRLCFGLEDAADLAADVTQALDRLRATPAS